MTIKESLRDEKENVHIGLPQHTGELVFVDFRTLYVITVGEAFMPPGYAVRFRQNAQNTGTFPCREA